VTEYVVIGDGAAGTTAAQYIRRRDPDGRITIYADDPNAAYYRAALTNYLIGELREDQLFAVPPDFYERNRVHRVLARVAGIDTANRRMVLASGGPPIMYDRLLIASGSSPNPPPFAGAELQGVMTMRTMQDARTFMEDLRSGRVKRAVVVGGGPLALEWAQALRARGADLTYVLRGREFMAGILDKTGSDLVASRLRAFGCDLRMDEEVAEVIGDRHGHVHEVRLKNSGQKVRAQLVCAAIGIRTNTTFLQESGITVNRGVPVDDRMSTNVDGVFAAGDVAEVFDPLTGGFRGLGLWEPARLQGRVAGTNMAGGDTAYRVGVMYNATRLYDLDFAGLGRTIEGEGDRVVVDLPRGKGTIAYRKLVLNDGKLVGAILLGHRSEQVRRHGLRLKKLIGDEIDVSAVADQLLDPAFDLPSWMASQRGELQATRGLAMAGAVPTYSRLLRSPVAVSPLTHAVARPASAGAAPALLPAPPPDMAAASSPVAVLDAPIPSGGEAGPTASLDVEGGQVVELGGLTRIGRRPEMDLVLADPSVSGAHAEIRLIGESYVIADAGSRNGTFVNEQQVTEPTSLTDGDAIRIGGTKIRFSQAVPAPVPAPTPAPSAPPTTEPEPTSALPPVPVGPAVSGLFVRPDAIGEPQTPVSAGDVQGALEGGGRRYELVGEQISVGRDPEADVSIEDPAVSYTHAQITRHGDALYLRDLGSRNGTWVNGALVSMPYALVEGDVVHLGEADLVFRAVGGRAPAAVSAGEVAPAVAAMGQEVASPAAPETSLTAPQPPVAPEAPPVPVAPQAPPVPVAPHAPPVPVAPHAPPVPVAPTPAATPRALQLRVTSGSLVGLAFKLTPPEVFVGRDPDADVALSEPTVSWRHLRLAPGDSGWTVTDLGSSNGTMVSGQALEANLERPIEPGTELQLGEVTLRFEEAS
jgi:NADPH-dependent 2,4-dienoyl-CoA reductase/sulfur reductase-like enzyme/pSer/pThr/pTyr-binding forkhead associated (FHA) protein